MMHAEPAMVEAGADVSGPALRYHGGKYRLAPWIQRFLPPHGCYVESFGGAAGVLLQKPPAYAEVYNDLDGDIVNFFRVLRDPGLRADLIEACRLTPYAREEFELAYKPTDDPLERARRTAVRAAMGFGSAGATKASTGFRTDTRRKYGTPQHVWADYPGTLAAVGERFCGVLIENRPAIDVIRAHDGDGTLHFVDPPYVHETRVMRGRSYRHEMSDEDHEQLLQTLLEVDGMVVLCGYESRWQMHSTEARISAGRGTGIRTECVWLKGGACAKAGRPVRQRVTDCAKARARKLHNPSHAESHRRPLKKPTDPSLPEALATRRPGRPRGPTPPKSSAERMAAYRSRQRAGGHVRVELQLSKDCAELLDQMRGGGPREALIERWILASARRKGLLPPG